MATDVDKMIDKINYARAQGYLTASETQALRQLTRNLANKKGDLGPKDRDQINALLNKSLNKKGQADKADGGLKPPTAPSTPPPTKQPTPDTSPTPGRVNGPTDEDKRWNQFSKNWKNLPPNDRNIVRTVWPNAGGGATAEKSFRNKNTSTQKALLAAVDDNDITAAEKRELFAFFGRDKDGNKIKDKPVQDPVEDSGPDPTDVPETTEQPDLEDGATDPYEADTSDDPDDNAPQEPTTRGGGKKVNVPKAKNTVDYSVPKDSNERLSMPNINKKITKEIQRITQSLVSVTREFIEGGINFSGIDYVPQDEIYTEDGESFFDMTDYNTPGSLNNDIANERLAEISEAIQLVLDKGNRASRHYNYAEFIDLFELRYNGSGEPYYRFSLELTGAVIDDLTLTLVEDENNL